MRPNRISTTENITEVTNDVSDQTGTHPSSKSL